MIQYLVLGLILFPSSFHMSYEEFVVHTINHYAEVYGVDADDARRISQCESRYNNVLSQFYPKEDSLGPFQEGSKFWISHARERGMLEDPEMRKSVEANIEMAVWVASRYGWGEWYNCAKQENLLYKKYNQELVLR